MKEFNERQAEREAEAEADDKEEAMLALERREKVGGLGFGALGTVVLVFAVWMMHYSLSSRLSEELVGYLDGIA